MKRERLFTAEELIKRLESGETVNQAKLDEVFDSLGADITPTRNDYYWDEIRAAQKLNEYQRKLKEKIDWNEANNVKSTLKFTREKFKKSDGSGYINTPTDAVFELARAYKSPKDKYCFKLIAEGIEMQRIKDQQDHWLFGKLWLYMFERNLIEYKSSQGAIDSIRIALERPMETNWDMILDVFDNKTDKAALRKVIAEKINTMLNDEKLYS
jgi:hypothetical protein